MDMMWIAVVAVVLVAVGAVVAKLTWRPSADEAHSVRNYQHALGTMEHLSGRNGGTAVRVIGTDDGPPAPAPSSSVHIQGRPGAVVVPPVPVRGTDAFPDPDVPLVFDDADPTGRHRRVGGDATSEGFRSDRARRMALDSMNHRSHRWLAPTLAVLAVAAFAGLAYAGSRHSNHRAAGPTATTATSSHPTVAVHTTHPTTVVHHHRSPSRTKTTSTTAPAQLVATSSTASTAVYAVSTASFQVTVSATGPCWVDAVDRVTGSTIWTGTLAAGASQVIAGSGLISVELGAPAATLTVDGTPVVFPTPLQSPFTATFQPQTSSTSTTTSSATAAGS